MEDGMIGRRLAMMLLICAVAAACKKDDPGGNGNGTGKVIVEKVVDAGGATLGGDEITVVIPANAITTATTISIRKSADKPFGTNQISETYSIDNLPETLYGPITITLGGISTTGTVSTFIGETGYAPSLGMDTLSYRMVPHTAVGGTLQVVIEPFNDLKAGKTQETGSGGMSLGILAAAGQGTFLTPEGHFRITYPVSDEPGAQQLGPWLEEAWSTYSNAPFSFSYAKRTQWPVEVTVRPLGSTIFGYCGASIWGTPTRQPCGLRPAMSFSISCNTCMIRVTGFLRSPLNLNHFGLMRPRRYGLKACSPPHPITFHRCGPATRRPLTAGSGKPRPPALRIMAMGCLRLSSTSPRVTEMPLSEP